VNKSLDISEYDRKALTEIHKWKNPEITWVDKALKIVNKPFDAAGDLLLDNDHVGEVIKKSIQGLTDLCNDAAHWTVRPEAIFEEFRNDGYEISKYSDVYKLQLQEVDEVVGWLGAKYKSLAACEGAGAGVVGAPGLIVDIPAILILNMRAIGEYASYYGFDITQQQERLFAMNVLGFASSPTDASKSIAMAQLIRLSQDVAKNKVWKELNKSLYVKIIQEIAKALGIRLTKAKLAQMIPVMGAAIGGGYNAYFTSKVCETAWYLYRERFLAEKYGFEIIEQTVKPADNFDPEYPEDIIEL
jgi:hypothetical protein